MSPEYLTVQCVAICGGLFEAAKENLTFFYESARCLIYWKWVYIDCAYFSRRTFSYIDKLITDNRNRMSNISRTYFGKKLHKIVPDFVEILSVVSDMKHVDMCCLHIRTLH
jgi:hypothetical protein